MVVATASSLAAASDWIGSGQVGTGKVSRAFLLTFINGVNL